MKYIAEIVTNHYIKQGLIPKEEREVFEYGFDITLYTAWSTALLILIGALLKRFESTLIIVFGFYLFQTIGGGYHANSHASCFFKMVIGLLFGLSFELCKENKLLLWIFFAIGTVLLLLFPIVLHPNKNYLRYKKAILTHRSYKVTIIMAGASIILVCIVNSVFYAVCSMFFLSGLSRICGEIKYKFISV